MLHRHLTPILQQIAGQVPVISLTGPRQSGKTTLVRATFPDHAYASLEDPDLRRLALEDPRGFLDHFPGPAIFDEAQRAPELFSYLQTLVDADDRPGRFILSGSQNFLLLRSISQSLAGRCAIFNLLPLSLRELLGRPPLALEELGREPLGPDGGDSSGPEVMATLFRGFYPRIHDKALDPNRWLRDYYQTYVERDVRELVNVGDLDSFGRFVRLCAGRNGQLLNLTSLGNDAGISHATARRWVSILESSFLIKVLQAHHRNFSKRLIKTPKLYFLDTGLLCYLLGIRSPEELRLHASRGAVFESFVLSELLKTYLHAGDEPALYFWRDSTGHEIDVLLERGSELTAVEVKSGQTLSRDFLKGLEFWRGLVGDPQSPAALVYAGDRGLRYHDIQVYRWADL